jgi:demethylmenaquinone methyltransferase/2-methoxy-6-polyprenyl-1,4-benzoquinol methylase
MTDRPRNEPNPPAPGSPLAADGSPYPSRQSPTFERDVQAMFAHIVRRYDWFDHAASLGNDYLWRPRALWELRRFQRAAPPIERILDFGCGTGDLSRLAARQFPRARVLGLDFTSAMVAAARRRTLADRGGGRVDYARGTARRLPVPDAAVDVVMSAFVVRNLVDLPGVLREAHRVLRPRGALLTLEITEPAAPWFRAIFHAYFDHVVPWLGAAVQSAGPYRYLPESLRLLPGRSEMMGLLREAGFSRIEAHPQSLGIVTTYLADRS